MARATSVYTLSLTTNGSGAASDVINFGFNQNYRRLNRVVVDYDPTAGAGSITSITDGDGKVVYTSPAAATDIDVYPSAPVVGPTGAAVTNGQTAPLIRGPLTVAVTAGGASKPVLVKLFLE